MEFEQQIKTLHLSLCDFREKLKQPSAPGMSGLQVWLEKINSLLYQVDFHHLSAVPRQTIQLLLTPV